jgi:GT2 family glycosyltransferase
MRVEIDLAYQEATAVFISGWVITENALENHVLTFSPFANQDQSSLIFHPRNDVCDALHIPGENCTGFIAVLDLDDLEDYKFDVIWGDSKHTVNLLDITFSEELVGVDDLAPGYEDDVAQLLRINGLSMQDDTALLQSDVSPGQDYFDFTHGSSRVHFDQCSLLDEHTFFVSGWVLQRQPGMLSLRIRANNAISEDILTTGLFYPRADVVRELKLVSGPGDKIGVSATIVFEDAIHTSVELLWEVNTHLTHTFLLPARPFAQDEIDFTEHILSGLEITTGGSHEKILVNVMPALRAAWKNRLHADHPWEVRHFGKAVADPTLTVIIPIYARYDFVQHQMAQFSLDSEFEQIEVIYVLDDPSITHEFLVTCFGAHEIFKVPFKVVLSSVNLGFAGANNLGFRTASAEHVLFINSDILPVESNWTGKLLAQFHRLPNVGILGATLLYEDDSVQHRGMQFCKDPSHDGLWMNYHPQKGFPLSLCDDFKERRVPAVTGACMLMKKALFSEVQGFDVSYILGDFEDSDLCLRVRELGYDIYVSGSVSLYHLERLSQNLGKQKAWKHTLSMVNGLLHTRRWNNKIESLMESEDE